MNDAGKEFIDHVKHMGWRVMTCVTQYMRPSMHSMLIW